MRKSSKSKIAKINQIQFISGINNVTYKYKYSSHKKINQMTKIYLVYSNYEYYSILYLKENLLLYVPRKWLLPNLFIWFNKKNTIKVIIVKIKIHLLIFNLSKCWKFKTHGPRLKKSFRSHSINCFFLTTELVHSLTEEEASQCWLLARLGILPGLGLCLRICLWYTIGTSHS